MPRRGFMQWVDSWPKGLLLLLGVVAFLCWPLLAEGGLQQSLQQFNTTVQTETLDRPPPPKDNQHPKLDTPLSDLANHFKEGGLAQALDFGARRGMIVSNGMVRAVAVVQPGLVEEVANAVESFGGIVEVSDSNLLQLLIPVQIVEDVADISAVVSLSLPFYVKPLSITSEGVEVTAASAWHAAGIRGRGVKVGVLDVGFKGYRSLLGSELPSSVTVRSFRSDGDIEAGDVIVDSQNFPLDPTHGTAVSETIYDMAPEAQLFFANFSTVLEASRAVTWFIEQGVDIVSFSGGLLGTDTAPGDGSGYENDIVARAQRAGILWINAAGNQAKKHWSGFFNDSDEDRWHNFQGADEGNTITLETAQGVWIYLRWDDWVSKNQDYDLHLYNSNKQLVARSVRWQNGSINPWESIIYVPSFPDIYLGGRYFIAIYKYSASRNVDFDLFVEVGGGCAATVALSGEDNGGSMLQTLRALRDDVLARSDTGERYIRLFYEHSGEIASLLLSDSDLRAQTASFLRLTMPIYQTLVAQQRGEDEGAAEVRISSQIVYEAERLLQAFSARSSSRLQADLYQIWQELDVEHAEGKTAPEIWHQVLGENLRNFPPGSGELEYKVSARSLIIPADSRNALTVGATYWGNDSLEDYSSHGPTKDGRTKPDLTGPTGVSTRSYGSWNFNGTSASTPHVSGAAALVKSRFPTYGSAEIQAYLERNALDLGVPGKDNAYGAGRLQLPPTMPTSTPMPTATPTPTPTPTLTPPPTATPTPSPTLTPTATPFGLGIVVGRVDLQGRSNDSGATITLTDSVYTATTATDGNFTITEVAAAGTYIATAFMPGYLSAQRTGVVVSEGVTTTLPLVKLMGGNADNDSDVDIYDLTLLGANFGLAVPPGDARADITGDGTVNIFDLVLVGANYGLAAPRPWP